MGIRSFLVAGLLVLLGAGCAGPTVPENGKDRGPEGDGDVERLHDWLTGFFELKSGPGGGSRPAGYMLAAPIPGRNAGRWVYVAQWRAGGRQAERQLVYHLQPREGPGLALDLFAVRCPLDDPTNPSAESLASLGEDCLDRREGCRVRLSQDGLSYVGGTRGRDCPTQYRGAERLRIELAIREDEIREWIQGYDASGRRLWSAAESGRVFRRARR